MFKRNILILSVLTVFLSLIACANTTEKELSTTLKVTLEGTTSSDFIPENYPIIDGSTSTLSIVRGIYNKWNIDNVPINASKTVPSYKKLIDGEVDMIIVPYPSEDILALAKEKGVELEMYQIAAEALVFITPIDNDDMDITREQIRDIYLNYGITNWTELGGPDRELVPICRNADSGSQSQMDNLVLDNEEIHSDIEKNYVQLTMEGMLELVAFYHNGGFDADPSESYALGYTLFTYVESMGDMTGIDEHLKMLSYEGVVPTRETIADGTYPLADGYYAVILKSLSQNHSARTIINWLQSEEGSQMIEKLGYISKK